MANYFAELDKTTDTIPADKALKQPDVQSVTQPAEPVQKGNYFANLDASPVTNANAQQQQPDIQDNGATFAALDAFNRQFGRMAEGALQIGANLVGATDSAAIIGEVSKQLDEKAAVSARQHPIASGVGGFVGQVGRTIPAAMATGGANLIGQIGAGAATNMAIEGLEYAPDARTRADKMAMGAVTGGIGGGAGFLISKAFGLLSNVVLEKQGTGFMGKIFDSKKAAATMLANEVDNVGGVSAVVGRADKAKNLGTFLSPAETIGTSSVKTTEQDIVTQNPLAKKALMEAMANREGLLKGKLDDIIDNFTPAGKQATIQMKDDLFEQLKQININKEQADELFNNPVIVGLMKDMGKTAQTKELSALPMSNISKLNALKMQIDDDLYSRSGKSTAQGIKPMNSTEKAALMEARDTLTDVLTKSTMRPDGTSIYAEANKLSQQLILQKNVLKDIKAINLKPGQDNPTLAQIHQALFASPEKKEVFLKMVQDTGGNANITRDLIDTINYMKTGTLDKIAAREVGEPSVSVSGRLAGIYQHALQNIMHGKYNAEMTKLLTDNKWQPAVEKVLKDRANPNLFVKGLDTLLKLVRSSGGKTLGRAAMLAPGQGLTGGYLNNNK